MKKLPVVFLLAAAALLASCTMTPAAPTPSATAMASPVVDVAPAPPATPAQTPQAAPSPTPLAARPESRAETISLEGMDEQISARLYASPDGYSFYYDAERFAVAEKDGRVTVHPVGAGVPQGNELAIEHFTGQSVEQVSENRFAEASKQYGGVAWNNDRTVELEDGSLIQTSFSASNQDKVGAAQSQYFLDDGRDGTYVFAISTASYEAAEGFGARYFYTLKSFALH